MRPVFLGPESEVFGCYYPGGRTTHLAAVLCPGLFGEQVQQFRLLHLLAERLADAGVPALRFDWYGTGDSAGDLPQASTARWQDDLGTACGWILRQARCRQVVLVGWRAGATHATRYAAKDDRVAGVVLWDPVVDGADYLAELRDTHRVNLGVYLPDDPADELLGFRVPLPLQEELASLQLASLPGRPAYVIGINPVTLRATGAVLAAGGPADTVELEAATMPSGWLAPEDGIYDVLVPVQPLEATAAWISRLAGQQGVR